MWVLASTTAVITDMMADTGEILSLVIAAVVGTALAVVGLGYAFRLLKRHVLGRKF